MRYIFIIFILFSAQDVYTAVFSTSYEEKLKLFTAEREAKKSKLTAADKLVMKNAGEYLMNSLPNPGIHIGEKAPDFMLKNAFGESVSLTDELKNGPVVLVFYRGAWCPYCNLHLHTLQESLPEFNKYGARLITITPQKPDKSAEQLKEDGFQFEVLSDLDSSVMKAYKLYFDIPADLVALYKKFDIDFDEYNGEGRTVLPVPASFVIDQNGVVRAMQASTDYKQRMEPAAMIDMLKIISTEKK